MRDESELADVVRGSIGGLMRRTYALFGADTSDFVLMSALGSAAAESQVELAERLGINRTIMVRLVDRLEAEGYVTRRPNPSNRRAIVLSLTPAGSAALSSMRASVSAGEASVLAGLSARERRRLHQLLAKLMPVPSIAVTSTGHLVAQAHFRLRRMGDSLLRPLGLRTRHFASLGTVARLSPCPQRVLAEELGISEPAAAQVVEELVQADLVSRGVDPSDRRRYALSLTSLGRKRVAEVTDISRVLQADIRQLLGDAEENELRTLLQKLLASRNQDG